MSRSSHQTITLPEYENDLPTFYIELETVEPAPSMIRVKLVTAPDNEGGSETYWVQNPLYKNYSDEVELGQALYKCLFGKEKLNEIGQRLKYYYQNECAKKTAGRVCLRILLDFSSVKGHEEPVVSLPWELLHDGLTWLGQDPRISIARRTTTRRPFHQVTDTPLRVLLAYAEPQVLPKFDGEVYLNDIAEALKEITWLDLVQLPHTNRTTLKQKIKEGFHIIHFLGHGEAKPSSKTGLDAYINLESLDVPGKSDRLSAKTLAEWFKEAKTQPALVVLTACQSGIADRFAVLGAAQALLDTGISAVVAFQAMLRLNEARWFVGAFYKKLASHATVDDALQAGRMALDSLQAKSLQSGTERSLKRLLKQKSMIKPIEDDTGTVIDSDNDRNDQQSSSQPQTVKFPAWAVPILLLNGNSRLGQEPPPSKICWKLPDFNILIEMVYIPEGDFYIDKYPVIHSDYCQFAIESGKSVRRENVAGEMFGGYPVTNANFQDAQDFAQWTGRCLPSVEEWIQAALSGIPDKNQPYPWGYEFRPICNTRESGRLRPMSVETEATEHKKNINPSGMCGIIGNVAEFALAGDQIKVCGGSYRDQGTTISIQHPQFAPDRTTSLIGFRCIAKWPEIKQAQQDNRLTSPLSYSRKDCQR